MSSPCVIDIEASGFGRNSYPIEVGYVLPDGRAFCMLIRPLDSWTHWDANAERLHGISRETLLAYGIPVSLVARRLNADLAGQTVYCDGWAHDYSWMSLLFDAADTAARFRLESINKRLRDTELGALDGERAGLRGELALDRHRAGSDARVLQTALARVASRRR